MVEKNQLKYSESGFAAGRRPNEGLSFGSLVATENQGGQIGRIFAYWAIVYSGQFCFRITYFISCPCF
jgi:hypothetical protein